jgi:hypothetical protein
MKLNGHITFDQSHGDASPCPESNCEKTKHNIKKSSVFHITRLPPSSEPDTGCFTWRHNNIEHIPVFF